MFSKDSTNIKLRKRKNGKNISKSEKYKRLLLFPKSVKLQNKSLAKANLEDHFFTISIVHILATPLVGTWSQPLLTRNKKIQDKEDFLNLVTLSTEGHLQQ